MRLATAILLAIFLGGTLIGCGGEAAIPKPPDDTKAGPPPGTSNDWNKKPSTKKM